MLLQIGVMLVLKLRYTRLCRLHIKNAIEIHNRAAYITLLISLVPQGKILLLVVASPIKKKHIFT